MSDLPDGWVETTLGEVTSFIGRGVTPKYSDEGVVVINQRCIREGKVLFDNSRLTDPLKRKVPEDKYLQSYDVVICSTGVGTLGRVSQVKEVDEKITADSHVTIVRASDKAHKAFLGYYLKGHQKHIEFLAEGSTGQTELPRKKLEVFPFNLPSIPEQKAIADMLSSFDEKIELLREQNKTLEILAQTIFKEWFVNFNYPDATGEMVDSELGEIPRGWRVGGIRCLVEHVKMNAKPFDFPERAYQHYSLPAFDSGKRPEMHNGSEISSNKYVVVENCFLVSKLNPSTPRIWAILNPLENSVCSTEFQVIKPNDYDLFGFVYGALTSYGIRRELSARAHGTSSSHQRVSPADILDAPVVLPSDSLINQYSIIVNEMLEKVDNNYFQIQTLSKTRDTLLPKLMSGQVRV